MATNFHFQGLAKRTPKILAMKTLLFLIALSVSFAFSQNSIFVTQAEYQNLKQAGLINQTASYSFSDLSFPSNIKMVF